VADLARRLAGLAAITGDAHQATWGYLMSRCLAIAGGSSEIVRNQIAERILGLPPRPPADVDLVTPPAGSRRSG
jgi:alkylation response protein AidB-like acyl-CoA dehydrogenase